MPTTRRRRIVISAVMALAGIFLAVGMYEVAARYLEPPEIQASRAIKLGMTKIDVQNVMRAENDIQYKAPSGEEGMLFGRSAYKQVRWLADFFQWSGIPNPFGMNLFPVRVRFDKSGRVDRIERGDEVEESPQH